MTAAIRSRRRDDRHPATDPSNATGDPGPIAMERIVDVPEWLALIWAVTVVGGIGGELVLLWWLLWTRAS